MNLWKLSTIVLTVALVAVARPSAVWSAPPPSEDSPRELLQQALDHLKRAKAALEAAQVRFRRHRAAVAATEFAIRAVEKELDHEGKGPRPKDPPGPGPKDPPGPTPRDPPGPEPRDPPPKKPPSHPHH